MERGQPYPPGAFPRSPAEMGRAFWDPHAGLYGMFDVWSFKGCDSVVSSGLGGGSLIYANVLLRKDERWFVHDQPLPGGGYESWPISRADLDPHYDAVEKMMGATPYPLEQVPFDDTPKTHAMQDAAAELGLQCTLPPLAVSFASRPGGTPGLSLPIVDAGYGNVHGVPRRTCRLCGECDIGCNEGAKNSLDHTYLSAAAHHGADIRTSHEVKAIRPRPGGGYEVDYVHHADLTAKKQRLPIRTISCDRLVLGAGTYGTTFLLLKSREAFPGLSDALGTRFSGNGDLLTFLMRAKDRNRVRPLNASRGPVITTAIRLPDELDGVPGAGRGAYIEDGGYPGFTDWIVDGFDVGNDFERAVKFLWNRFTDFFRDAPDTNLSKEISDLIGDGALTVSSLPLLGMGRDTADGRLRLKDGRLAADWTSETSEELFTRVRRTMQGIADVLGAHYADNPMWFRKRIITVHPLGGAPMGAHRDEGVCDAFGEVFGFPGLYIADGAAMPGPVGPNPSLTIAAHADRLATRLLENSSARRGAGGSSTTVPSTTGAEPVGGPGSPGGGRTARRTSRFPGAWGVVPPHGVRSGIGESRWGTGTVPCGCRPYVAVVHRGDEGLRHLRRERSADRRAGRGAPAPVVPADDHRGGHRPVPGRARTRGEGRGLGGRGRRRRPPPGREGRVQPVRRRRRGRPAADEVPAVLHRRGGPAAHAERAQERPARAADADLAGHQHALRAPAGGACGRGRGGGRRDRRGGRPAHPADGLRAAAHDVPHVGPGRGGQAARLRQVLRRGAVGGLRPGPRLRGAEGGQGRAGRGNCGVLSACTFSPEVARGVARPPAPVRVRCRPPGGRGSRRGSARRARAAT
ncbi:GMC family oxidoreductase [Actinomadura madurae]|uniref:GMC family oxidoreductase n=1 Tax=Actinomadura madurae TaxID=1993 RepID=UPI0020D210DF|nr:GMC oxidoreductase [Actinomadura madurae]MCQ0010614.1 GMC oxidoreductase [Actinomadura madurae]